MYRVYVIKQRKGGSEVIKESRTETNNFDVAKMAFWFLYADARFHDPQYLLLMSCNNKKINSYRYCSIMGDRDYLEPNAQLKDYFDE